MLHIILNSTYIQNLNKKLSNIVNISVKVRISKLFKVEDLFSFIESVLKYQGLSSPTDLHVLAVTSVILVKQLTTEQRVSKST